ncbi:hypothetical protein GPJ56_005397 [Histomonas meleagridis]|uniref:uncharacterized protein n=1 Tax=Histomonas meleagridis TaxID=135588 RepID=UPI003559A8B1|nr:hypothetical protein GPJ56_005397 [Histomonas meleagridis]KAH0801833.1 hypothetical protein GO595_005400 [Histomonas meleagridis]
MNEFPTKLQCVETRNQYKIGDIVTTTESHRYSGMLMKVDDVTEDRVSVHPLPIPVQGNQNEINKIFFSLENIKNPQFYDTSLQTEFPSIVDMTSLRIGDIIETRDNEIYVITIKPTENDEYVYATSYDYRGKKHMISPDTIISVYKDDNSCYDKDGNRILVGDTVELPDKAEGYVYNTFRGQLFVGIIEEREEELLGIVDYETLLLQPPPLEK